MDNATRCQINGCDRPRKYAAVCNRHYKRIRNTGTPNPRPQSAKGCAVEGCDRRHSAKGWCNVHYTRWLRTGETGPVETLRPRFATTDACSVDGCERPHWARGYCDTHHTSMRVGGRLAVAIPKPPRPVATYEGTHSHVRTLSGAASRYLCRHCPGQAAHWAYDHQCPNEMVDPKTGLAYSLDPARYFPLCAKCHCRFDSAYRQSKDCA